LEICLGILSSACVGRDLNLSWNLHDRPERQSRQEHWDELCSIALIVFVACRRVRGVAGYRGEVLGGRGLVPPMSKSASRARSL
jgi:hypothetical protein